jgi:RNA polymerase sigma-70 factor (family 1)
MLKNPPTDSELWEAIRLNDNKAFNLLFERYWSAIYTTAFSYLPDDIVCSEIVNDIFLRIWKKRNKLEITSFKAYLTSAARYHVYKQLKARSKSVVSYVEDYDRLSAAAITSNHGDERIQDFELAEVVNQSLGQLPKRCQEIFQLSRQQHLTNHEISEQLGISKRSVENQLTFALKHLRNCIKHFAIFFFLF